MPNIKSESVRGTLSPYSICYRKSRQSEFVKKKKHLLCKFNEPQTISSKRNKQQITTTYVKPSIINFTDIGLTDHQTSLLNLGLNFAPAEKRIPFMEINEATESVALNLEYHSKTIKKQMPNPCAKMYVIFLTKIET